LSEAVYPIWAKDDGPAEESPRGHEEKDFCVGVEQPLEEEES
jgi:hypothetical protein